jgi:predicted aspartyl protease
LIPGRFLALAVVTSFGIATLASSQSGLKEQAVRAFRDGSYDTAIPLLEAAFQANPKDSVLGADLLSALVYEGRRERAMSLDDHITSAFPDSPEALAARADLAFFLGDMGQAEQLDKRALKIKESTARAYWGLYRLYRSASLHRTARLALLRAYAIDQNDAAIRAAWFSILPEEKKKEVIEQFLQTHPDSELSENLRRDTVNGLELAKALNGHTANLPDGESAHASIKLIHFLYSPTRVRGVGVEVSINGGKRLHLLLDTGASGILINQRAADRLGLAQLGSHEMWGVGDGGVRKTHLSVADTCAVGTLNYRNCIINVMESSRSVVDEDGLLGTNFFSAFLISLDFENMKMDLSRLPSRAVSAQGYDRVLSPGFTPVFKFGHHLMVTSKVNNSRSGLFLIDTGSSLSNIDRQFAEESTRIHGDEYMRVKGISGKVNQVFQADRAMIQFAGFQQQNLGMTVFNLNTSGKHQEVRIAGILGLPVLALFRLTLDYRDGQVKFEYRKP